MDASRIELHTTAVASAGEAMCAALAGEARPTAAAATLAAAAGVRVLAISHTLLPTGVGNGFGRVAKGRRQNDSSGISTILLIQFSPLALPYALLLPLLHIDPKV